MKFNKFKFKSWIRQQIGSDSYRDVCGEVGISAPTLCRLANGRMPDLDTYAKVCTWLNVKADFFFNSK